MVLQGLQFSEPHLGRTANNLALDLGHAVQVNAYLSPAAAKGLELHFDYHDVFVLQLDGAKRWRVWEPLERTRHPVRSGPREPMPTFDELREPAMDLTLQAGDCLYLPRGFPHAAETIDSASSHLTIGIIAPTWQQAVRRAVDEAVAAGDLRESIAVDVRGRPGLEALVPHLDPLALRRWMAQEVWRRQPATRLRPLHPPTIGLDTRLVVTPGPLLWLTAAGDRVELGLGDRALTMPAEAADLLDAILRSRQPFSLGGLDVSLDDASRLVVGAAPRRRRGGHTWLSARRASCAPKQHASATSRSRRRRRRCRPGCSSRSTVRGGAMPSSTASSVRTPRWSGDRR